MKKNLLIVTFLLSTISLFAQVSRYEKPQMTHNASIGNAVSINPLIHFQNSAIPLRNRYIPYIGYNVKLDPKFLYIKFGFEIHKDKIFIIQDRLELGLDLFKIIKPSPRQHLNCTIFGTKYNFQEFEFEFYKQFTRYYKIEYQYDLTDKLFLSIYYEKDADWNFSPKEPRWEGRWDVIGVNFTYQLNSPKTY